MTERYGVGILGIGVQGARVAAAFGRSDRFRTVAGFDPAGDGGTGIPLAASPAEVVDDPQVECLYIASPPAHHRDAVMLAAAARKPVLCEKPLAPTPEIAAEMVDAVESAAIIARVNFGFTTDAVARTVAAAVADGTLGPPVRGQIEVAFPRWPRGWQSGAGTWLSGPTEGGFTREVISHFAYLADRLLGPGTVVESRVDRGADGLETGLDARVQHGHVAIEIRGSVGAASKDTYRFALECRDGTITIEDWDRLDGLPLTASDESPIAAFAAVLDGEPRDLADFPAGARVVQVIEALLA